MDSSSIEGNQHLRRANTDRTDGDKLLTILMRYCGRERDLWRLVQVPSVKEQDAYHLLRELEFVKKQRTGHGNRTQGLLIAQDPRDTDEIALDGNDAPFKSDYVLRVCGEKLKND